METGYLSGKIRVAASQNVREKEYWLDKLAGEWIRGTFPVDHPEAGDQYRPQVEDFELSPDISSGLFERCKDSDHVLHIYLTAALILLVDKYTFSDLKDYVVAAPIYKQAIEGEFINTLLPLRNRVAERMTFKELLVQVKETVSEAVTHQNYPVALLAEHDVALCDIAVLVENIHDPQYLQPYRLNTVFSFSRRDKGLKGRVSYNGCLYEETTIGRLVAHFQRILSTVLANLDITMIDLEVLTDQEKTRLLEEFNDTQRDFPTEQTIHGLFEGQVPRTPDHLAVVARDNHLSYGLLNERADRLAAWLHQKGVKIETVVGIMAERCPELLTGILGIMKAGAAYLPIAPDYPPRRTAFILADSEAQLVLTRQSLMDNADSERHQDGDLPKTGSRPEDLAYVLYTSGSTGKPKGVMVAHRSVVNILTALQRAYPFGPSDAYLLKTSVVFDVSVAELFGWYPGGGRLTILEQGAEKDPFKILDAIHRFGVTHINFVPSMFHVFSRVLDRQQAHKLSGLKYIFLAGEALLPQLVRQFREISAEIVLENLYGPTEGTVYASKYALWDWDGLSSIPIGRPLQNVKLYILDQHDQMQPIGVPGELCIAGAGVARAYLNQPESTADKFVNVAAKAREGARSPKNEILIPKSQILYKTGDLARWLPDGNIDFLGRIDHQVKIRGFRVELGEIENQLLNHPQVKQARVIARESDGGAREDQYLCAYVVPEEKISGSELREFLTADLPDYMIPGHFVILQELPLTSGGKLDIQSLPEPEIGGHRENYLAPRNEIEKRLARIWSEILRVKEEMIGIDDHFFELGGHSLRATTLVYRIYKEIGANIEIGDVFSHPTIRGLAPLIQESESLGYEEIGSVEKREYYGLSFAQRRLWVLSQFEKDSTAYNMPMAVMVSGRLDAERFARAAQAVADRHESLRTVFILVDGEPFQRVIDDRTVKLEQPNLRSYDDEGEKERAARDSYLEVANGAFDLERGPLFRLRLVRLAESDYLLVFNIHHIVSDGWSQGIIYNEMITLYNTFLKGRQNPLIPLKLQYKDYTRWHNALIDRDGFSQARQYWLEKFKDRPNGVELPLDHPRKPIQTFNGGRVPFTIDRPEVLRLRDLGLQEDATLFMSLLTLLNIFLFKYSGQRDIIIGSPIAGRQRSELHHMVGFLVNTLIYRNELNPDHSFMELLRELKQEALTSYNHQEYPFDLLVEQLGLDRILSQSPLFNVMLAHNNADTEDRELAMAGVTISAYPYLDDFNMSKFDLIFFMDEFGDQVKVRIEYNSDLFERSSIDRMAGNFLKLVENVLADREAPIAGLNMIADEEYERIVKQFNDTAYPFAETAIQQLFEDRVEKAADGTAVVYNEHQVSYAELNRAINRFSHYLKEAYRVKPNDIIGVSMDRSIEMVIVLWGIIKAGAAYLAVDPTYPRDRVLHVLADSQSAILVIDEMRPELFGGYQGDIVNVHIQQEHIGGKPAGNPGIVNNPADILYVNYTSGSTGVPNGAMLSHDCLTNLIKWQNEITSIDCSRHCLQFTSINFCVSFQEIMGTLTAGGQLYLIGDIERQNIDYLMDFLCKYTIEILFLPFSYLNFLFNESSRWHQTFHHSLRHIITAGEQLKITAGLKRFLDLNPKLKLHNHYGSTEMHVVTSYTLDASSADQTPIPPAGKPISNVKIYILDEHFKPVPMGVWGELFVAGKTEILGYIRNPGLTDQKLVRCREVTGEDKKLYRSGDVGRWMPDGNIELRGRKDFQVKIRGFRIEPGEVESKLLSIESVRECVVVVKEDDNDQKYLAAYVILDNIDVSEVRKMIGKDLPQYMVPKMVVLDHLPLMPNGKVDRSQLPEPQLDAEGDYVLPRDEVEEKLAEIWRQLLNVQTVGINDDFFDIGGHSLLVQKLINAIHKEFKVKVSFQDIFQQPTIEEMAELIQKSEEIYAVEIEKQPEQPYYEASYTQSRLWIINKMNPGDPGFHLSGSFSLNEEVDEHVIRQVFEKLMQRHESLRTHFEEIDGRPVQIVRPDGHLDLKLIDISQLPAPEKAEKRVEVFRQETSASFDLSHPPLFRVRLIKAGEEAFDLLLIMHHIITDGWSLDILKNEFRLLYESLKGGKGFEDRPLDIQYRDYAAWHNRLIADEERMGAAKAFWKSQGSDFPVLSLPFDGHKTKLTAKSSAAFRTALPEKTMAGLKSLARQYKASMFMILLAGFNVMLSYISGQDDIVVCAPGAARQHEDLKGIVGYFVNTLVIRNQLKASEIFIEFLNRVQQSTMAVLEYQSVPLELIYSELKIKYPELSVFFNMSTFGNTNQERLTNLESFHVDRVQNAKFELVCYLTEFQNSVEISTHYYTELFKPATIERITAMYLKVLEHIADDPQQKVGSLLELKKKRKITLNPEPGVTDHDYREI
jgi:tyrocidine synthetase-3